MKFRNALVVLFSIVITGTFNQQSLTQVEREPLTTQKLRDLASLELDCYRDTVGITLNRCIGRAFQLALFPEENSLYLDSPRRKEKPGAVSTVVPDYIAASSFVEISADGVATEKIYNDGAFFEVKAVNGTIRLSSSNYQALGLIDAASLSSAARDNKTSAVVFVTTANTTISPDVIGEATLSKVALYQIIAHVKYNGERSSEICFDTPAPLNPPLAGSGGIVVTASPERCGTLRIPTQELPLDPDPADLVE